MPLALLLASHDGTGIKNGTIAFLYQDNQTEMQHDFFGPVIPLAPALHEANGIIKELLDSLSQDDQNKVLHGFGPCTGIT